MIAKQLRKRGSNLELGPDNVKLLVSGLAFGRAIQAALGKNKLLDGLRINNKGFYEQKMSGLQIGIREWQILCRDFLITPCMGTVKENSNHYHGTNISMKTEGDKLAMEI